MVEGGEQWSCPECELRDLPEAVRKHFKERHLPVEMDIRYNRYVSFPHEQIPRFISDIPLPSFPEYRETYLSAQLIQLFQQVRLSPLQYSAQLSVFESLKSRIETQFQGECMVEPAWDELPRLALGSSPLDMVINLSQGYLNGERLGKYAQMEADISGKIATIGGSFLQKVLPIVRDFDKNVVVYYCKSKEIPSGPQVRRVPGQEASISLKLKYIGLYFQVNGLSFDLSAYNTISLIRTALVKAYTDLSPMVTILCVALKAWAEQRRITGKQLSLLSPFCLFVMLIHFLQNFPSDRSPILPQLRQNFAKGEYFRAATDPEKASIRNCRFSLGELFHEFYRYYANFNWKGVGLSMRKAGVLAKPEGADVLIQNPLPPYDNLADQYIDRNAFFKMAHEFKRAYMLLNSSTEGMKQPKAFESSLLSLLLDPSSY
jgi:hypothetical protein